MLEDIFSYAKKNLIKMNIYIKDPYVAKYVTGEKITEIYFVGEVGGILGLFLGFSFISSVEVFYIFCCKLIPLKTIQILKRKTGNSLLIHVKGYGPC